MTESQIATANVLVLIPDAPNLPSTSFTTDQPPRLPKAMDFGPLAKHLEDVGDSDNSGKEHTHETAKVRVPSCGSVMVPG